MQTGAIWVQGQCGSLMWVFNGCDTSMERWSTEGFVISGTDTHTGLVGDTHLGLFDEHINLCEL